MTSLLIGSASAKYPLFAPVFVPMFMTGRSIRPELTQAAFPRPLWHSQS
ncbi:MAG: AbgT family transporter [Roseibacillus sp.]|nr:AbgT family transporter [Roseibacillus sp.]MDP7308985.1 AbgT family transporter [Roseibacillus sp.]MDP7655488.1 AbgT family transporter [Roseibacillus sp.]HJM62478.1 AbgT family transporter [Roseibacillus sp.]